MSGFDVAATSQLLLFVFLTSLTGASALIETRRLGVSRRMYAAPVGSRAMLLGAVARTSQQAVSVGVLAGMGLAAIGGAMVPLDQFTGPMRQIAHLTPHAWALDGFAELLRRDGTVADVLPQLGVLALFAAALLALGSWRLRAALTR
ncbi:ABC transporter permease [Nonomuraea sp. NPDC001699]